MAEQTASKTPIPVEPRPWWRRRRFWQAVIAVEIVAALTVSIVAANEGSEARTPPGGLPPATSSGI
jgi:hypothetical protein